MIQAWQFMVCQGGLELLGTGTNLVLPRHDRGHGPAVLVKREVVSQDHDLKLLVEVGVLPCNVLELLERVFKRRRAPQLLHLFRGVVQHRVVGPAREPINRQ